MRHVYGDPRGGWGGPSDKDMCHADLADRFCDPTRAASCYQHRVIFMNEASSQLGGRRPRRRVAPYVDGRRVVVALVAVVRSGPESSRRRPRELHRGRTSRNLHAAFERPSRASGDGGHFRRFVYVAVSERGYTPCIMQACAIRAHTVEEGGGGGGKHTRSLTRARKDPSGSLSSILSCFPGPSLSIFPLTSNCQCAACSNCFACSLAQPAANTN